MIFIVITLPCDVDKQVEAIPRTLSILDWRSYTTICVTSKRLFHRIAIFMVLLDRTTLIVCFIICVSNFIKISEYSGLVHVARLLGWYNIPVMPHSSVGSALANDRYRFPTMSRVAFTSAAMAQGLSMETSTTMYVRRSLQVGGRHGMDSGSNSLWWTKHGTGNDGMFGYSRLLWN